MEKEDSQTPAPMMEDTAGRANPDEAVMQKRKEDLVAFLKTNYSWIAYAFLAIIVYITVKIRTSNLAGLKDITTGTWTLGPDLDPFFFLRWAKYIVEHGSLMAVDTMRYVPLGFNTRNEYLLHPYLIAWFHKIAVLFGSESVTHSAVLYPAFIFGLTVIVFFFFTRAIFSDRLGERQANIIALIASFLFSIMPPLLPRTIAGIPEKEPSGFLLMFIAFYFFVAAFRTKNAKKAYAQALVAGAATALMAYTWGGFAFIFIIIAPTIFIAFLLGKMDRHNSIIYTCWLVAAFVIMNRLSANYSISGLLSATTIVPSIGVLVILWGHYLLFETKLKEKFVKSIVYKKLQKIPRPLISVIVIVILGLLLATLVFGKSFISTNVTTVKNLLVKPATSRLIQTVAENRQPYFTEWVGSFGPYVFQLYLTFWLFFVGSIYLFYRMIYVFDKKERGILTAAYTFSLLAIVFSRYSPNSTLNGENFTSIVIYFAGFAVFGLAQLYYLFQYHKEGKEDRLKKIDLSYIFIFAFFFLGIVAARATVRTIMVLVPPVSIIIAFFIVSAVRGTYNMKDGTQKFVAIGLTALIILSSAYSANVFYQSIKIQAPNHIPSAYTQQWQKAMSWVRDNTSEDAVFAHWWDYGYWLQSIGERATVLDGGNAISYWNHLMGRHALTGPDPQEALEFLYAHEVTHFLVDSTDIGKYGAYSSIGSDASYDRASYIPTFLRDQQRVQERKNTTVTIYNGGVAVDEDIVYELNGTQLFFPAGSAGVAGVLVERNPDGTLASQPIAVLFYQGQQYEVPMKYAYDSGQLFEFEEGIDSGVFIYPAAVQNGAQLQIDVYGAMFYLSTRTVHSQLARLYLYQEDNSNFELVHSEDDFLVTQIKAQNPNFQGDMIQYQGFRGPIRIWEVNYPEDIAYREEFISTEYPEELLWAR